MRHLSAINIPHHNTLDFQKVFPHPDPKPLEILPAEPLIHTTHISKYIYIYNIDSNIACMEFLVYLKGIKIDFKTFNIEKNVEMVKLD